MKLSDKATAHILVKDTTNSEWDNCGFAIVHLSEEWKKEQQKRLEMVKPFAEDYNFQSLNYYDTAVEFYRTDESDQPDIDELLTDKEWAFVEFGTEEQEAFAVPENRLDCYRLVVYRNGNAIYKAYGKHTSEEFWTEEFDLNTLCNPIAEETELEKFCRERFKHLSNAQLVARVNSLPDFGWDDEGVELQRRRRISNGAFDYAFKGNTMVVLKDEKL
ncbi:hypothetical protein [Sphingobacterium sp. JB170]|uniref:hypothetical protein n=1 Tax=Sphingobacterium sp. JB170 TaxID=1434842 RepID=UPI00097ED825|nr:hypothetical protein [Sphingobacterium sp. JB170]SJN50487.1 hypothetical protein FM107_20635 [Sphingobacterium sp. JB170]